MYVPPAFRVDRAASLAFASARGFGLAVANDGARPVASPIPFAIDYRDDGTPFVQFHVARANPLTQLAARGETFLIAVSGADAYVAPDWYLSPEQAPTWLYEAVHLSGVAKLIAPQDKRRQLDRLTECFETPSEQGGGWTTARLTSGRLATLMQAIVGIEIDVTEVEGSAKLNQNKSDVDFVSVAAHLRARDYPMAQQIAARMVALRPNLSYETAAREFEHGDT
jgi:transcriptional regulator